METVKKQCLLVTGSSGYIGSNLITIFKSLPEYEDLLIIGLDKVPGVHTHAICDMTDKHELFQAFELNPPDYIIHLAALIQVGESQLEPDKYWHHNFVATLNLLDVIRITNPDIKLVFMSSAAVYQTPERPLLAGIPVQVKPSFWKLSVQTSRLEPSSVYGQTKLACERAIQSYCSAYGMQSVILRLFNVGGGTRDPNKTFHLIPIALKCLKEDRTFQIFGNDYDTEDGTCVRDYIHVKDVSMMCAKAINLLTKPWTNRMLPKSDPITTGCYIFNAGKGRGYSVLEVLTKIEKITGLKITTKVVVRRSGDPDILVASRNICDSPSIGSPQCDLKAIIEDEWNSLNSVE